MRNKLGPAQVGAVSKAQNSKRTSTFQSIDELRTFYEKKIYEKLSHNVSQGQKTEREDLLGFCNMHSVAKLQKN